MTIYGIAGNGQNMHAQEESTVKDATGERTIGGKVHTDVLGWFKQQIH